MTKLYHIIRSMRPHQWTKTLVVFAGLIFSHNLTDASLAARSVIAFFLYCALSGAVYLINDIADAEKDRLHETKKNRPIPSGKLRPTEAGVAAAVLMIGSLILSYRLGMSFFLVALLFSVLNVSYSISLKRVVLLDVFCISISFVLRAIAGVEALAATDSSIELSPWLLICTLFLSLFLAFCKRRYELVTLERGTEHRESLAEYSPALLDQLVAVSAGGAVLSYSIYTIWPDTVAKFGTSLLVYTIPLVLIGVMRYQYLVYNKEKGGSPSDVLLSEKFILVDVFLWIVLVIAILYFF